MREIKFRAYSKDHGFLGDVYEIDFSYGLVKVLRDDFETTHTLGITNVDLIQFTGLKDKSGNPIYEGDVVDATLYGEIVRKRQVIFDEGVFSVKHGKSYFPCLYELSDVEVIGNIYENPDLINQTNGR